MHKTLGSFLAIGVLACAQSALNPKVKSIVDEVSQERIVATLKKLESFGTRNTLSVKNAAAREWIAGELKSYSPRLQVSFDSYKVKALGRITRDVELVNVVAVLPGTINKDRQVILSAHYDTLALRRPQGGEAGGGDGAPAAGGANRPNTPPPDPEAAAPGVTDDGSGTAAVMELARVMSQKEFDKTLVFVLFTAEEQGLAGAQMFAEKARKEKRQIEAVLNNDIIGSTVSGNGEIDNHTVRVFSEDPADSPSRQVARYIKDVAERYIPAMNVDLVFRSDRVGRGGDHTPFNMESFAAVRISSAVENYTHQHSPTDTFENTDPAYITRVAKINGAAAATLALAPKAPVNMEETERRERKVIGPMIARGKSRYDAQIRWKTDGQEADVAQYVVLMRPTTAPFWEKRISAGKASEVLLPGISIDNYIFAVQAVDTEGNESLPAAYLSAPRTKLKLEQIQ